MSEAVPPESDLPEAQRSSKGILWRRGALALGPALLLSLIALWEVARAAQVGQGSDAQDWQSAAAFVRENLKPGELIVFAPQWVDPVGRQYLGDLIPIEMAARMDAASYSSIWELSIRGQRAPETRNLQLAERREFGAVTLQRFEQEAAEVLYRFVDHADQAKALRGKWRAGLEEVGFAPHRCIKVVPRPDETIPLGFSAIPRGSEIVGYVGLADIFTRRDVREPGRLELWIDGKKATEVMAGIDDGWVRFSATMEGQGPASVEFRLTAVGPDAKDRRICFAAEVRR